MYDLTLDSLVKVFEKHLNKTIEPLSDTEEQK